MAELHYFPMYASDWLAGEATTRMTPEQESAFLRLLLHAWLSKGDLPCSIPADDEALAELSRLRKRWGKAGAYVKEQFVPVEDAPHRLRNPRLWRIYQEQAEKHNRRVNAGALGGKATATKQQTSSNATSNATAMLQQSESESESQETNPSGYPPEFEMLWTAYPKKLGANNKRAAYKAYNARLKDGVSYDAMFDGVKRYRAFLIATGKEGTEYVKMASTFLGKDRHFADAYELPKPPEPVSEMRKVSGVIPISRGPIQW